MNKEVSARWVRKVSGRKEHSFSVTTSSRDALCTRRIIKIKSTFLSIVWYCSGKQDISSVYNMLCVFYTAVTNLVLCWFTPINFMRLFWSMFLASHMFHFHLYGKFRSKILFFISVIVISMTVYVPNIILKIIWAHFTCK